MADPKESKNEQGDPIDTKKKVGPPPPEATEIQDTIEIDGRKLTYTARTGTIGLAEDESRPKANIFYVAFTAAETETDRPITFCFNGGPGSSSVWLQLGAFGPKRVDLPDTAVPPPPPYRLVDNSHSLLDRTDLVFIDPVGTGFSRAEDPDRTKAFYAVEPDVKAVGDFIARYLSENHRWNSPRYLAGESYGTTRAAALADHLHDRGIVLNGLVLVSLALDFQTFIFEAGNDLPHLLYLPSYAATAHYHRRLDDRYPDLDDLLDEIRTFTLDTYAPALLKGDGLETETRRHIAERLAAYTGLDADYIEDANLRIHYMAFTKRILGQNGKIVGRLDSRYIGDDIDRDHHQAQRDPSYDANLGPYAAAINQYLRHDLGCQTELPYEVLSFEVNETWEWAEKERMGYTNAAEALRKAMVKNPHLKVLIANGIYDLATPFFAAEYTVSHLGLGPQHHENVTLTYYEAGHMMYFNASCLEQLRQDIDGLFNSTLRHRES